jgi:ribosome maturation factor RimP
MSRADDLQTLLAPVVVAQGCELWGLEFSMQGRHSVLRIFIDSSNGITVDDCERVSRQISAVLDVEDPIAGAYTLEVSSPGLDRQLYTLEQFQRYVGALVAVKLRAPYQGRKRFQGRLNGIEDGDLVVQVDDTEYLLPIDGIDKAHVVPTFDAATNANAAAGSLREGDAVDTAHTLETTTVLETTTTLETTKI